MGRIENSTYTRRTLRFHKGPKIPLQTYLLLIILTIYFGNISGINDKYRIRAYRTPLFIRTPAGQKWRILTFFIKAKIFVFYKQMIIVLWKKSKFFIFDHVNSNNWPYLAETKKRPSKFFICCKIHGKLPKNQ